MSTTTRTSWAGPSLVLLFAACQVPASCTPSTASAPIAPFDADRAWTHLLRQVEFGPRPSGTEANARCRAYLEGELRAAGLAPRTETFKEMTPAGEIEFTNVWADLAGSDPAQGLIIFGSHFDTKRMPFPLLGANDGASSTAVLLELARVLALGGKRPFTCRFLFLDGEESVRPEWRDPDNTYGSRHHANELKRAGRHTDVRAFVLLDMVGDKDLHLIRDTYSDRAILECFFGAARAHGLGRFLDGQSIEMRDDHLSFMAIGVKSIDLMDFDYGPRNSWWHTAEDTVDKCSKESLATVGQIVLLGLPRLEEHLQGR